MNAYSRRSKLRCAKLLLCDDHPPIRTAVTYIAREINKDVEIFEAGNGAEMLAQLKRHPDIELVMLDVYMPGIGGLELLSDLKHRYPALPVVVLSSDETRATVVDALERGAIGYICKSSPTHMLAKFLEQALNGNIALPTAIVNGRESQPAGNDALPPADGQWPGGIGLSPRQMEVLACLLRGMSHKQICRELDLADGTVKTHTNAVFRALKVTSRAQAVIEASRRGFSFASGPR